MTYAFTHMGDFLLLLLLLLLRPPPLKSQSGGLRIWALRLGFEGGDVGGEGGGGENPPYV